MMDNNRLTAYHTLMDVEAKKSYSNLALNHNIAHDKPDSPAFVRELVYGVLENKRYLDYLLGHLIKTPIEKTKASDLTLLRMGLYQLMFLDSIPPYAAVNECVNLAKRYCKGREGFINGVLRNYQRQAGQITLPDRDADLVEYLSVRYSYEPWIVSLWLAQFDAETVEDLLAAGNRTPEMVIRFNHLKTSKETLKKNLIEEGFEVSDGNRVREALYVKGGGVLESRFYKNGMFSVQDESSMLAVDRLDPQPGETVVDACAAPGGKSLFIAERMENRGQVIAWDIYKRKIAIIERQAERTGASIIKASTWDATNIASDLIGKADRVLVDAPCSGLGVIRRKPEIKYKKDSGEQSRLPEKQLQILTSSARYVKPGGVLVYSTCTISPRENEQVIERFLEKNPVFAVEEEFQLLPNVDNTDGFFICKMQR